MDPKKALLMIARVVLVACMLARQEFATLTHGVAGDAANVAAMVAARQVSIE